MAAGTVVAIVALVTALVTAVAAIVGMVALGLGGRRDRARRPTRPTNPLTGRSHALDDPGCSQPHHGCRAKTTPLTSVDPARRSAPVITFRVSPVVSTSS